MPPRRRTSPRSPDHKALGEAIETLRKKAGMTHEELAERTGMPFQRISELERGIANPTFATLIRVMEGLGVELSDVATLAEKIRDKERG
ncbi:MAG: helix-turn-helix transcriptional regulator [Solirubrobacterales bacterium]